MGSGLLSHCIDFLPETAVCCVLWRASPLVTSPSPKLRSFPDRLRQITFFEIGGLLLITPPFAWASGVPISESIALLATLALIAAIWNGTYNTCFDWIDARVSGRTADRRPLRWRVVHAFGFECGLLLMSLPVIMGWTGMGFVEALIADLALASAYVVYAFLFNLGYDRAFPIEARAVHAE